MFSNATENTADTIPEGYVRVTEVLRPWVDFSAIPEFSRDGRSREDVLACAADRGTRVHAYCDLIANALFVGDIDADCEPYVKSYRRWFDQRVAEVLVTETRINSENWQLSGQIDLICRLIGHDEPFLIDLKTPQTAARTWQLQTSAYEMIAVEQDPELEGLRRGALILSRTGGAARLIEHNEVHDEEKFRHALALHRFFAKPKKSSDFSERDIAKIFAV